MAAPEVDAVFFDVFGTVVDWYGGVVRDGERLGEEKDLEVDWGKFAVAWRTKYLPSMDRVRRREQPWTKLDVLHRASLEELLEEFGVEGLTETEKAWFNRVWHRLDPWPDSVTGIERVRGSCTVAALSNGNVSLLTDMAKRAHLPWDVVLSAELARRYKPDSEVYLMAAGLLDVTPERAMMVACHVWDLGGARGAGLRTAFVHRPLEWGPGTGDAHQRRTRDSGYDVVAEDILGPLRPVVDCHCTMCRRTSGHFAAFTATRQEDLVLTEPEGLRWYRSSAKARRGFCEVCGSNLFWEPASGERVSIGAGTLDLPTGLETAAHVFVEDSGDYYTISDGLPRRADGNHGIVIPADCSLPGRRRHRQDRHPRCPRLRPCHPRRRVHRPGLRCANQPRRRAACRLTPAPINDSLAGRRAGALPTRGQGLIP